jgi:hypothetical protein
VLEGDPVSGRASTRLAWGLCLLAVAAIMLAALLQVLGPGRESVPEQVSDLVLDMGYVAAAWFGALIISRRPGNRIGLLILAESLSVGLAEFAEGYVAYGLAHPGALPALPLVGWLVLWVWVPSATAFGLLLLLYPTGRLVSPRWRPVAWTIGVWAAVTLPVMALQPEISSAGGRSLPNPLGLSGSVGELLGRVPSILFPLIPVLLFVSASSLVVRFVRSRGVERQQLKWLAYAVVLSLGIGILPAGWFEGWKPVVDSLASWGILIAIAIAILRYRLYDIDRIINRTLVYGLLTILLGLGYAACVVVLGQLFGQDRSTLAVAGATLAAAALFQPARRRIQQVVDRRFNRRRYDAAKTIEAFSIRLREEIDLDTLSAELLAVVDQTTQPTQASLWLRPPQAPMQPR